MTLHTNVDNVNAFHFLCVGMFCWHDIDIPEGVMLSAAISVGVVHN